MKPAYFASLRIPGVFLMNGRLVSSTLREVIPPDGKPHLFGGRHIRYLDAIWDTFLHYGLVDKPRIPAPHGHCQGVVTALTEDGYILDPTQCVCVWSRWYVKHPSPKIGNLPRGITWYEKSSRYRVIINKKGYGSFMHEAQARKALDFVLANKANGITTQDVYAHVGVDPKKYKGKGVPPSTTKESMTDDTCEGSQDDTECSPND